MQRKNELKTSSNMENNSPKNRERKVKRTKYASKRRLSKKNIVKKAREALKAKRSGRVEISNISTVVSVSSSSANLESDGCNLNILPVLPKKTASEKKLNVSTDEAKELRAEMGQCDEGFRIVDIEILKEIVEDCACPSCKDGKLSVQEKSEERKGLSNRLHVFCHACDYEKRYYTS